MDASDNLLSPIFTRGKQSVIKHIEGKERLPDQQLRNQYNTITVILFRTIHGAN